MICRQGAKAAKNILPAEIMHPGVRSAFLLGVLGVLAANTGFSHS